MGPGAYSPERADALTKTKMANVNMGTSPSRATNVRKDDNVGPGQYDDRNYEMSQSSKGFIIGEKRAERVVETMGPGSYSPERAELVTKTRTATIDMGSSPSRGAFIKRDGVDVAPGQYDDRRYEMSKSSKGFIIGEKRAERV